MTSPLELLDNRQNRQTSVLNSIFNPIVAGLGGVGLAFFMNFAYKKPLWSGIQKHIAFGTVGTVLGAYIDKKRNQHLADRDAVFRHYIELHPEDFPTPERKKYADVLESWVPIR